MTYPLGHVDKEALKAGMGPLELATYRRLWRVSVRFLESAIERASATTRSNSSPRTYGGGFAALRHRAVDLPESDQEETEERPPRSQRDAPADAGRVATDLLMSRMFDERPDLLTQIRNGAPTVLIDVADPRTLDRVWHAWRDVLFDDGQNIDIAREGFKRNADTDVLHMTIRETPKGATIVENEKAALHGLSLALPFFGVSPHARSHLPDCLLKAATTHIEFPRFDAATIVRTIRIVTGKRCSEAVDAALVAGLTVADIIVAIRFDRTPKQCIDELRRIADLKKAKAGSRNLALSDLHGLGEVRTWARDTIADIRAWKQGLPWSAVSSGVALEGPSGCGKTTFASVFCAEAGLYMVPDANLAAWQRSGEGHLGHLLRAMAKSFEEARANAPACVFIDECDSIGRRDAMTHSHRDYSIQVVNALLAEIDGIRGREGIVIIGCSNDLSRCEPALLRPGRLDKIIRIGFPDVGELEKMFRVRLGNDLSDEDLKPLAEIAVGMVGADVERIVKDARRIARGETRPVTMRDLLRSVGSGEELDLGTRRRAAAHEAAHIVVDVLHFGPDGVYGVVTNMSNRAGSVVRNPPPPLEGTYAEYQRRLQILLAGRVGEHLLCGSISNGAGGVRGCDLDKATALAASMVASLGVAGGTPLLFRGSSEEARDLLSFREVRIAANAELQKADRAVRDLLAPRRKALEAVATTLFERGRIDGAAVGAILASSSSAVIPSDAPAATILP